MKYTIEKGRGQIKKEIKYAWEVISLVFVLSIFTAVMALAKLEGEMEEDKNDYIEVFRESEIYELLDFDEIYEKADQVYENEQKDNTNTNK